MTTEEPAAGLFKNFLVKKSNWMLSILAVFLLAGAVIFLRYVKPKKMPEIFQVTGAYQAYFEIETDNLTPLQGEDVNINIYLTTSGEEFSAGVVVVEWDASKFVYKNAAGALSAQFLSSFLGDNLGKRVMTHFVPGGDTPMTITNNQTTLFATLTLTASVDNPGAQVKLSAVDSDNVVHFVDSGVDNSCDQSLADQNKLLIQFGTPQATSTPSPTSPPAGFDNAQLQVKVGFLGRNDGNWKETIKLCLEGTSLCHQVDLDDNGFSSAFSFDSIAAGQTYNLQAKKKGYLSISKQQILNAGDNGTIDMGQMPSGDLNVDDQINSLDWSWMKLNFGKMGE